MDNRVTEMKPYGRIELTLKELMQLKNISRGTLARSINARYEVIDKWYNGSVERMDLDVLARICYVLDCRPEDIIIYKR